MSDHKKFKELLKESNLTYKELAEVIEMDYNSVKNQLAPAKKLPRWAVSMLLVYDKLRENK